MFAHAMGHNVFRRTAGAAEGVEVGGSGRKEEWGERALKGVWWPHVTVAAQCLDIAGFRAKHRHRG